ncbi:hypothetical protein B0T25DRAFT_169288 [Lasiosphaeria hispida]|uniref:Uncharacterized protein n=1 Tax=Lasiosphaeria hispida TaxID=260671 RepID=A0AAJ0MGF9_9PEZI|nr:hypothetical protein B0T25DRAFT_169288 [Lasiosphaeria hispida]
MEKSAGARFEVRFDGELAERSATRLQVSLALDWVWALHRLTVSRGSGAARRARPDRKTLRIDPVLVVWARTCVHWRALGLLWCLDIYISSAVSCRPGNYPPKQSIPWCLKHPNPTVPRHRCWIWLGDIHLPGIVGTCLLGNACDTRTYVTEVTFITQGAWSTADCSEGQGGIQELFSLSSSLRNIRGNLVRGDYAENINEFVDGWHGKMRARV